MRVLITGSSGFLGRNLIGIIQKRFPKWEVFGLDKIKPENINYEYKKLEFTSKKTWSDLLEEIQPDFIYHLIGVYGKVKNVQSFNVHTSGFFSFIDSILNSKINPTLLILGSATQYGVVNANDIPIKENHPQNPFNIQGITKKWQEEIALFYHRTYGINVICTRPSNFIGKDISRVLLPGLLNEKFSMSQENIDLELTSLESIRDYIDVRDVSDALIELTKHKSTIGKCYNISSSNGLTNLELIRIYERVSKKKANIKINKPANYIDFASILCNNKIKEKIKWKSKYTIQNAVEWSILKK